MSDKVQAFTYVLCTMVLFGCIASEVGNKDFNNASVVVKLMVLVIVALVSAIMIDAVRSYKKEGK